MFHRYSGHAFHVSYQNLPDVFYWYTILTFLETSLFSCTVENIYIFRITQVDPSYSKNF